MLGRNRFGDIEELDGIHQSPTRHCLESRATSHERRSVDLRELSYRIRQNRAVYRVGGRGLFQSSKKNEWDGIIKRLQRQPRQDREMCKGID